MKLKKKKKTPLKSGVDMSKMTLSQKKNFVSSLKEWTPIMTGWNDCFSRTGWRDKKDVPDVAMHVVSIGFYLNNDNEFLYTCHGRFAYTDSVEDINGIPWGMITSIKLLG